ncbi:MAG: hypothetical protein LBD33_00805 [Puniceicoccales bacterium]|nr:hypothetical protein [Puniceicoccales bacterium]
MCAAHANCQSLCERSPFCTKKPAAVEKQSNVGDEFEFHGVCSLDGECLFSLLNRTLNRRYWLKFEEKVAGISVKKYDENRQVIELALPDGTIKRVQMNKFKPHLARSTRSENVAIPVPEEARRKFLQIVRDGEE